MFSKISKGLRAESAKAVTGRFGPNYAFLVILGQILPFFAHFVQCPAKNQCELGA